jgi:hypothetical protein
MHATTEELWDAMFSVGLCRGYIWRTETELSLSTLERKLSSEEEEPPLLQAIA